MRTEVHAGKPIAGYRIEGLGFRVKRVWGQGCYQAIEWQGLVISHQEIPRIVSTVPA